MFIEKKVGKFEGKVQAKWQEKCWEWKNWNENRRDAILENQFYHK